MAIELFLVPMEGTGTEEDPIRAKYALDPQVSRQGTIRFSRVDHAVVMLDATQDYLDAVRSQSDAISLSAESDLDTVLTGRERNTLRDWLEARGIPGLWLQGETKRGVIRGLIGMFLISQRMEGKFGQGIRTRLSGLDTDWDAMPQASRTELMSIAEDLRLPNPSRTAPLRDVLKSMGDGMQKERYFLCGFEV